MRIPEFLVPFLVATLCGFAISIRAADTRAAPPFRIAGYLPDYRFADFDIESARRLTDLILFSVELTEEGTLDSSRLRDCPWPKLLAFKTRHRVRLLVTIGGWERSANFPTVVASREKRRACVETITRYALEHRLDGIDLDWEHPRDAAEERLFGTLLQELRTAFEPHGLMLTVTLAGWQKLPAEGIGAVDGVQVMAYDHPGRHSTLENSRRDVRTLLQAGVPAEKITLGVPFYGRHVATGDAMTYREIVSKHDPAPNVDLIDDVYFNGPGTIRKKLAHAAEIGLGGVMIWELGQDAIQDRSLLKVIRETVDANVR